MRNTANFHPEWGYLAPAPSFMRTVRAVLVATAVGVTVGAGAVFSWASHQGTETSVGERTLVRPVEAAVAALPQTSVQATKTDGLSSTERRSLAESSRSAEGAAHEAATSPATRAPAGIAALTAAHTATEGHSVAAIATPTPTKDPTLNVAPIKKKFAKRPNAPWRFASREEPIGFGEYSRRRSWGGYYGDGGSRRYENW